jgi:hypothetical protein
VKESSPLLDAETKMIKKICLHFRVICKIKEQGYKSSINQGHQQCIATTNKIAQKCGTVLLSKKEIETEGQVICQVYSVGTVDNNAMLVISFLQVSDHENVAQKLKKSLVFT